MPKEHCPYCAPSNSYKDAFAKAGDAAIATTIAPEKRSAAMLSLEVLYDVAQSLENQAQRLRNCFGLVIASQPPAPSGGQLVGESMTDCELLGRLAEIIRCLRRTRAAHEETIDLRRV
jgi:hypothetical protein